MKHYVEDRDPGDEQSAAERVRLMIERERAAARARLHRHDCAYVADPCCICTCMPHPLLPY